MKSYPREQEKVSIGVRLKMEERVLLEYGVAKLLTRNETISARIYIFFIIK